ncbi:MAG: cytochrome-c oxidase, cbb3-type subunit III [Burkholderiales bacterium]|nr:cytochrome-c oxidase, cbb3-type subunit III [Burkholderiales bacterium]MDE1927443.1 cytochrome-c oxidase, cbb3-type subunit III [Burkholderiales bacterium]MDE2161017.1 cytochrome-c oxidase, cbb3-type subunit III [Burkholderiales bacterium]MDE2502440.1 cytochrome-c oxidase, cbb3-type subunit III [Burkholderiales bacterium]
MSDFVNPGWSYFVAAVVIGGLMLCIGVLIVASKRKVMAGDNTTGHVWDEDLREMNNPLPRWWMWLFVITVVFAAVYLSLYPGLGSNPGLLKWSSAGQWQGEQDKARAALEKVYAKYTGMSAEQLMKDPEAMGIGNRLFLNTCAPCHGSDARGAKGIPNLTDNDWLGAGTPEYIEKTIREGRIGMMPVMAPAVGTADDVRNLANYVLSLSGSAHDNVEAELGKPKFAVCAACHGADGKGNQTIGAPNLTDHIWLHGWGEQAVIDMITKGKTNVMPPQGRLLTSGQIHVLAAYVWSLSHGNQVASN